MLARGSPGGQGFVIVLMLGRGSPGEQVIDIVLMIPSPGGQGIVGIVLIVPNDPRWANDSNHHQGPLKTQQVGFLTQPG
jgi:hypothetical protein